MTTVTLIAYVIAFAVPALTVYVFVMLDVFGTGKFSTILVCLGWGAVGAFLGAWVINNAVSDRGVSYDTLTVFVAPVIEELLKALVLLWLITNPRFRYIVDGAVYGIAVGIGFAWSENIAIYLPGAGDAVLGVALSRTLSTSLMHATASGLVGIGLGRLRRTTSARRNIVPVVGIVFAIVLHGGYNFLARELEGMSLLLVAIGIGIGGGVFIAWQIARGLAEEKERFAGTLGLEVDNFGGERRAVQRLGGMGIEQVFGELVDFFGNDNITLIRRLLALQGNIGILRNNLKGEVSDRLREAWQKEIDEYQEEVNQLRRKLGPNVMLFMKRVFPVSDETMQDTLNDELGALDPTLVHRFDMFMRVSGLAENFTPEQLAALAERLSHIDIFRNVSLANLENLSRAIKVQEFDDDAVLFNQGDQGNAMYLIEAGQIAIYVLEPSGEEKQLRTFEPGKVVGEFSLLDGQPRSARAQAVGRVRTLMLKREEFTWFIQSRPQVVLAMLQYLADKARHTTNAVEVAVKAMSHIGQGNYMALAESVTQTPQPATVQPPAGEVRPLALQPDEVTAETPVLVGEVFSSAAAELQHREQTMREQLQGKASA